MKVKLLAKDAKVPARATEGAAGYDMHAYGTYTIKPGERAMIETAVAVEIPSGFVGIVKPRSGLAVRHGIDVLAGVIDEDYRGEVKIVLINHGDKDFHVIFGERIAQLVVLPYYKGAVKVTDLSPTARANGGFGSTGK